MYEWAVLLLFCLVSQYAVGKLPHSEIPARIPEAIKPTFYDLLMHPHLSEGTFSGTVSIQFNLTSPIKFIPVHQHGLTILRTDVVGPKGKVGVKEAYRIKALEYWVVEPSDILDPGIYNLTMTFAGNMRNKLTGLYRSVYTVPGNPHPKYLSTTKFEPTYARQSFPCFDEPMLKAKFKIHVIFPKDGAYHALGNSDVVGFGVGPNDDEKLVEFRETPLVSTYLIAYIVSDFKTLGPTNIENLGGTNFSLQVWSPSHLVGLTEFARNIGKQCLIYFIKYFDIPYPLKKMDFVSIPDFSSGAMENWGLVTFRETDLLANQSWAMLPTLHRVAQVTAHELAHQWFGNLVTMKWWSDIWLNEGFARFMQFKGVFEGTSEGDKWKGEMSSMEDVIQSVLVKDAMVSSHAIINEASSPGAITEVFDLISYGKGASILHMLEHLLGSNIFMNGIRKYLKLHQFGNAESNDLWAALSSESDIQLESVMETWLRQPGYPVLNMRRAPNTTYITQTRFVNIVDKSYSKEASPFGFKWDIPIMYRTSVSDSPKVVWLYRNMSELVLDIDKSTDWIKLNYKMSGLYRVNYDVDTWTALIHQLDRDHEVFTPEDRANLLDDSFSLAFGGYLKFSVPLEILSTYILKETARLPLLTALQKLSLAANKLGKVGSGIKTLQRLIVSSLYEKILGQYVWDFSKKQLTRQIEVDLMVHACKIDLPQCKKPVRKFFNLYMTKHTEIVPEFQSLVYSIDVADAEKHVLDEMYKKFENTFDPMERKTLLSSIVASGNDKFIDKLLTLSLKDKVVRRQDFFTLLSTAAASNLNFTWKYYRQNYEMIVGKFGVDDRQLGSSITAVASKFATRDRLKEVKDFFKKYETTQQNGRKFAIEKIIDNINWKKTSHTLKINYSKFIENVRSVKVKKRDNDL